MKGGNPRNSTFKKKGQESEKFGLQERGKFGKVWIPEKRPVMDTHRILKGVDSKDFYGISKRVY
jgi:hypothetical protein